MNDWHRPLLIAASSLLGLFIGQYWSYHDLRREHADRLGAIVLQSRFILEHFIQWPRDENGRIVVPQLKEGENDNNKT